MSWLLFDYGEVLSLPQPASDRMLLENEADYSGPDFWATYWQHRPNYDRGNTTALEYWEAVLGRQPTPHHLDRLIECDVAGWLYLNHDTIAAATRAAQRGLRLAILSNAPHEVANAIDRETWATAFRPRLFSCRLQAIKPESDIYRAALRALDASPREVTFLDDRSENVLGAQKAGIKAELFVGTAQIDAIAAV